MDVFSSSVGLLYLTILPYNVMPVGYKGEISNAVHEQLRLCVELVAAICSRVLITGCKIGVRLACWSRQVAAFHRVFYTVFF